MEQGVFGYQKFPPSTFQNGKHDTFFRLHGVTFLYFLLVFIRVYSSFFPFPVVLRDMMRCTLWCRHGWEEDRGSRCYDVCINALGLRDRIDPSK